MRKKKWYKLDNVGKFYASLADREAPKVFRYSVTLKEEVDSAILQDALEAAIEVFTYFNVNLKRGLFWYYLDECSRVYRVTQENTPICYKLYNSANDFLYRVSYYKKRINFEISHIVTDGRGSIDFFKMLVSQYLRLRYDLKIDLSTNSSSTEKSEDSFEKYYQKVKRNKDKVKNIYNYHAPKYHHGIAYLEAHMDVGSILKKAHEYDATLTTYLTSVLIYSFKDVLREDELKKTIRIDIPVDLRNYFKSSSSKNYFGLTSVSYQFKSRDDTLKDIIKSVNEQLKKNLTKEELIKRVNLMMSLERNILCRITPIFVKNIVLNIADLLSIKMSSSCMSNVGKVEFPKKLEGYIENVNVLTSTPSFNITICSFKNDLSIGVSSIFKHNEIIKNFFNYLAKDTPDILINVSEVD